MIADTAVIARDVKLGQNVSIYNFVNLYGCEIKNNTKIGSFVEIQKNAFIGSNCKISSHTFVCEGVTIGNNCFIGHGVMFINDRYPRAVNQEGLLAQEDDWILEKTVIQDNVNIGTGAIIMCGIIIGEGSTIGAGAVVTKNIPPHSTVIGVPGRIQQRK